MQAALLDERLVDLGRPFAVDFHGARTVVAVQPQLKVLCQGIAERADPDLAFTVRLELLVDGQAVTRPVPPPSSNQ